MGLNWMWAGRTAAAVVLLAFAFGAPSTAEAEPIRIVGMSWAETREDQVANLRKSGFACEDAEYSSLAAFTVEKGVACKKDRSTVMMLDSRIIFNCEIFGMCGSRWLSLWSMLAK